MFVSMVKSIWKGVNPEGEARGHVKLQIASVRLAAKLTS